MRNSCRRVSRTDQVSSPANDGHHTSLGISPGLVASHSTSNEASEHDEVTNAATILEFLAWGKRKDSALVTQLSPGIEEPTTHLDEVEEARLEQEAPEDACNAPLSTSVLQLLLPERGMVLKLVEYHVDCLLWYHGSFHGPTFHRQVRDFYDRFHGNLESPGADMQWVALLFAVMVGSMTCGNKAVVASWGFHDQEQVVLSGKWLQAVLSCLNAAHYMSRPSIRACQAIATLTISAHILGHSNQQAVLLASAVRIAQSLGLHQLDDNSEVSVERETGRRVWMQLCSQDWFSIPFSETYLINPLHCKAVDSLHCDDATLESLPPTVPTVTSYCRYLSSIAALMPQLLDGIAMSNTAYTKYEQVLKYDRLLRSLASEHRPSFLCNIALEPDWPVWVKWARSAAAISSAHKIIMIHRKYLSLSFTNPAFAFTRKTCIAASKTILKEAPRLASDDGPVLWIFHAFTVAAGITLCLDVLHRDAIDPACLEHCQLVEVAVEILRCAHNSKIARRGTRILADMLLLERQSRSERGNSRKRKAGEPPLDEYSARRRQSVDIRNVVRDFQRGVSPTQSRKEAVISTTRVAAEALQNDQHTHSAEQQPLEWALRTNDEHGLSGFFTTEGMSFDLNTGYIMHGEDAFGSLLSLAQTDGYI